jgi:chromosome segregation ATPase
MSAPESTREGTLFDLTRPASAKTHTLSANDGAAEVREAATTADAGASADEAAAGDDADAPREEASGPQDRKRIADQLDALKRKELELRRALVIADHPELADAVRALGNRAYAVTRAEAKLAQGLSKGEVRRREVLEKKLGSLRSKRAELDTQIAELEGELAQLGTDRLSTFESERMQAMEQLLIALGQHEAALHAAGLEASALVPEIGPWLPELETIAQQLVARADA